MNTQKRNEKHRLQGINEPQALACAMHGIPKEPQALACANVRQWRTSAFGIALLAAWFCACHQPAGVVFPLIDPPVVWPRQPQTPRIKLIGVITGSADLKAEKSGAEIFKAALRGPRPPIKLASPHGVAIHRSGKLAIADGTAGAVHLVDLQQRTHVLTLGSKQDRFLTPLGATWAGERLFITDAGRHEIVELDARGIVRNRFGEDRLKRPVGIVTIPKRRQFYVVDGGAHCILVFDLAGQYIRSIGLRGAAPGEFNYPTHIAYDGGDRLAVADSGNFRVQIFNLDGGDFRSIGRKGDGAGDLALPKGVAFDSDGHLYVVDAQFENFQIFDAQGQLLLAVGQEGGGLGEFSLPAGLAIDEQDRIWVADADNRRVQVFQYLKSPDTASVAGGLLGTDGQAVSGTHVLSRKMEN